MARGPGEVVGAVPWADCFPTINFALPPRPFLEAPLSGLFRFSVLGREELGGGLS